MGDKDRIDFASDQLLRYGGRVFDDRILNVLDALTDINDDMYHARDKCIVVEACQKAADMLLEMARTYGP